uniref:NADH-ubiquinone oxidoreductase chain 2 n=1 Tax=Aegla aff. longirostri MHT-2018 TaxID=2070338 RepID=A0A343S8T9_9EUCA|nr:NADH dehydrogenase subunit 2 [Aegla aff. longirostri MHT-2018]
MYLSLLNTLFLSTLIMGTMITLSASSWFSAWTGLELNLLSFIPLIVLLNNKYSAEAALKYFLIQALGSSMIIFASVILLFSLNIPFTIIAFALLLKLGAAPFHFWFPQIMEGLLWPQAIILMTIQKMAPMFLISYLIEIKMISHIIIIVGMLSAILGAVMGLNQTSLRKIMAFSSINHMAWMLLAMLISENMLMFYFIFYCLISASIMILFYYQQTYYFNQLLNQTEMSNYFKMLCFMSLLSLGGLPPFSGFIPKWILIQEMIYAQFYFPLMVLLLMTLITLYFYLRMAISFFTISSPKLKQSMFMTSFQNFLSPMLTFLNMFGLLIPSFFIFF